MIDAALDVAVIGALLVAGVITFALTVLFVYLVWCLISFIWALRNEL